MTETPPESQSPEQPRPAQTPAQRRPGWGERVRASPGTYALIGVTLSVFVLQNISTQLLGGDVVLALGAKSREAIAAGQWWRLVTPLFIHVGLAHVFVNMYSLSVIGPTIENLFGSPRALVFYFSSGFSGVLFSLLFTDRPSVGASGSIFGFLGALVVFLYLHRGTLGRAGAVQLRQLVIIAILNLGIGFLPGIDNWGHIGGLIAGAGLTWLFGPRFEPQWMDPGRPRLVDGRPWTEVRAGASLAGVLLLVLSLLAAYAPVS